MPKPSETALAAVDAINKWAGENVVGGHAARIIDEVFAPLLDAADRHHLNKQPDCEACYAVLQATPKE